MKNKLSRDLKEIWEFYEGDKLSIAEFLRGPHKEGYDDEQLERMKKEADEIEEKLDSKRDSIKRIKAMLQPVPEEKKVRIIQKYSAEIMTCASYMRAMGLMRQAIKEYEKEKESGYE